MIEKFLLPQRSSEVFLRLYPLTCSLLPCAHGCWQSLGVVFCRAKEVHVVWHDHVTTDGPTVPIARAMPLINVASAEGSGEILTHPLCRRDHRSRLQ